MALSLTAFIDSLESAAPPDTLDAPLNALWWGGKQQWEKAHAEVNHANGPEAAWVHAWLHRWEGDRTNAAYWYRRAGRPMKEGDPEKEWREITSALLDAG